MTERNVWKEEEEEVDNGKDSSSFNPPKDNN
jgi:hypothetical protein